MPAPIFRIYIDETASDSGVSTYSVGPTSPSSMAVSFTEQDLRAKISRLHERDSAHRINDFGDHEELCAEIGRHLFDTFMIGDTLDAYRAYRNSIEPADKPRLALHIPRSLYYLPWELLKDPADKPGQFLSLLGSIIRYDATDETANNVNIQPPDGGARFVLVVSNPTNRAIPNIDPPSKFRGGSFKTVEPAEFDRFTSELDKNMPHGVIFYGHGEIDTTQQEGLLFFVKREGHGFARTLRDDRRFASVVGNALGRRPALHLIYLFACEGAWVQGLEFYRTLAGAILKRSAVGAVCAAQAAIHQRATAVFMDKAITELLSGVPIDLSLSAARDEVQNLSGHDASDQLARFDWWIPVLYARTGNFDFIHRPRRKGLPLAAVDDAVLPPRPATIPSLLDTVQSIGRLMREHLG